MFPNLEIIWIIFHYVKNHVVSKMTEALPNALKNLNFGCYLSISHNQLFSNPQNATLNNRFL